ncbi:MAG: hypothetical protein BMS9Abin08_0912 [Gammaproteobacteria bacterium]|nr:MAG: hypothetical protein BMS9Abin08_0912 [Gammaproteobacteria bacterium]
MANEGYHEPVNGLPYETCDMHRAINSLMEGLSLGIRAQLFIIISGTLILEPVA